MGDFAVDSGDIRSSADAIGLRDRKLSGWCNADTRELVEGVVITPGLKVVDIGSGDGEYVSFCAKMGADVTFVDIQEEKVRALEARLQSIAIGKFEGIVSECNPIPLPDGCADVVISTEVLEHVRDPRGFLREIVRLGSENASYLLTVPDARGEELVKNIAHPVYFQEPNHIQIFSSDDFKALADCCGLEVVRHEYLAGFWAIFYLLKWGTSLPEERLNDNAHESTFYWTKAWESVLKHPHGDRIRAALNNSIPRCQMIVAKRKAVKR